MTTKDGADFIKEYKNSQNQNVTCITLLEIWRSTEKTERHVVIAARDQGVSSSSMNWEQQLQFKHDTADAVYPGRWDSKTSYRASVSFWKTSKEGVIEKDYRGNALKIDVEAR